MRVQELLRQSGEVRDRGAAPPRVRFGHGISLVVLLVSMGWAMLIEGRHSAERAAAAAVNGAPSQEAEVDAGHHRTRAAESARDPAGGPEPVAGPGAGSPTLCSLPRTEPATERLGAGGHRVRRRHIDRALRRRRQILNMPIMIYTLNMPTVVAIGTASLVTSSVAVYSGLRYVMQGMVLRTRRPSAHRIARWRAVGRPPLAPVARRPLAAVLRLHGDGHRRCHRPRRRAQGVFFSVIGATLRNPPPPPGPRRSSAAAGRPLSLLSWLFLALIVTLALLGDAGA